MSRFGVALVALVALVPGSTWAQSPRDAEKDLLRLEDEYRAARVNGDVGFLEKFYGKERRLVGSDGSVIDRDADIRLFASRQIKPETIEHDDVKVSIYGGTAVVTGRERVKGTYQGVSGTVVMRFIDVLVLRDGRWQLVATQSTPIAGQ